MRKIASANAKTVPITLRRYVERVIQRLIDAGYGNAMQKAYGIDDERS